MDFGMFEKMVDCRLSTISQSLDVHGRGPCAQGDGSRFGRSAILGCKTQLGVLGYIDISVEVGVLMRAMVVDMPERLRLSSVHASIHLIQAPLTNSFSPKLLDTQLSPRVSPLPKLGGSIAPASLLCSSFCCLDLAASPPPTNANRHAINRLPYMVATSVCDARRRAGGELVRHRMWCRVRVDSPQVCECPDHAVQVRQQYISLVGAVVYAERRSSTPASGSSTRRLVHVMSAAWQHVTRERDKAGMMGICEAGRVTSSCGHTVISAIAHLRRGDLGAGSLELANIRFLASSEDCLDVAVLQQGTRAIRGTFYRLAASSSPEYAGMIR